MCVLNVMRRRWRWEQTHLESLKEELYLNLDDDTGSCLTGSTLSQEAPPEYEKNSIGTFQNKAPRKIQTCLIFLISEKKFGEILIQGFSVSPYDVPHHFSDNCDVAFQNKVLTKFGSLWLYCTFRFIFWRNSRQSPHDFTAGCQCTTPGSSTPVFKHF